jgi:hypothetical protein
LAFAVHFAHRSTFEKKLFTIDADVILFVQIAGQQPIAYSAPKEARKEELQVHQVYAAAHHSNLLIM